MSLIKMLSKLVELETQATPGPWTWYADDSSLCWLGQTDNDQENFVLGSQRCSACAEINNGCLQPNEMNRNYISGMRNAAPAILGVLGKFQPGDASLLWRMAARLHCPNEDDEEAGKVACVSCQEEKAIFHRLQEACQLMEAEP